jgi:uncharacterized RDD family membrane protein YckC
MGRRLFRRFAARTVDTIVCLALAILLANTVFFGEVSATVVAVALLCFSYTLLEPLMLVIWGRSVGKWVFGLRVVSSALNQKMSFPSAGVRSWLRQGNVAQSSGWESRLGNC